jgi:hypothetical protein
MTMRSIPFLLIPCLFAGCASQSRVAVQAPAAPVVAAAVPTKSVETRYEVRGYRDAANPQIRHEAHAVFRRTRVPQNMDSGLETVPRTAFAPASASPLPASEELAAELATQKAITADLRTIRASMAETERQMQAQYGQLVRQSDEARKLREQLEGLRSAPHVADTGAPGSASPEKSAEAKW